MARHDNEGWCDAHIGTERTINDNVYMWWQTSFENTSTPNVRNRINYSPLFPIFETCRFDILLELFVIGKFRTHQQTIRYPTQRREQVCVVVVLFVVVQQLVEKPERPKYPHKKPDHHDHIPDRCNKSRARHNAELVQLARNFI